MADVFSLMGKIAVDYSDAVSGLEEVNAAAEDAASGLESADSSADNTGGSLDSMASDADDAGSSLDDLGSEADSAGSDVDDLGSSASDAGSDVDSLASDADDAASSIDDLGDSASNTSSELSGLTDGTGGLADGFSKASGMGGELSSVMKAFTTGGIIAGVTAAVGALVSQIGEMVTGFQDSKEIIAMGTGATGDALTDMANTAQSAYSKIAKASSTSCDDVSSTLAELNTRFGYTGDELEDMTVMMQNFADVTGQDGVSAVDDIANMTHYWGMESDEIPGLLDDIVTASQGCQASAGDLQTALSEGAGAFQAMGYSTEEALAFLWEYSDTGGDVSDITQAMTKANSALADVTDDVPGAFQAAIDAMASCETTTEALNAEVGDTGLTVEDVFGKKVAQKLAQNIQSGNSSLDSFINKLEENDGALDDTAEAVTSTRDKFAQFGNRLKSDISGVISPALQTLGDGFTTAMNTILDFCEHPIESIQNLWSNVKEKFGNIKDTISDAMDTAKNKVVTGWDNIKQAYEDGGGGITGIASAAMEGVTGLWESGMDALNNITGGRLENITTAFKDKMENAKSTVTDKLGNIKENFTEKMSNVSTTVSDKLSSVKEFFTSRLGDSDSTTSSKLGNIASTVKDKMSNVATNVSDKLGNVKSYFTDRLGNADSTTSSKLGNIASTVKDKMSNVATNVSDKLGNVKSYFTDRLGNADSTTSSKLGNVASTFTSKMATVATTVSDKLGNVKSYFQDKLGSSDSTVSSKMESIRSTFSSKMESAKSAVGTAIENIRGKFNFSWSLPSLKLPHIGITGSFSLNPISVPHFSIDWYAKAMEEGMILDDPAIFGIDTKSGNLLAGGEAGSETVVGTESLMNMIQSAVGDNGTGADTVVLLQSLLDWFTGQGFKDAMVDVLINDVSFNWNDREVGRLVRKYA